MFKELLLEGKQQINWEDDKYIDALYMAAEISGIEGIEWSIDTEKSDNFGFYWDNEAEAPKELINLLKKSGVVLDEIFKPGGKHMNIYQFKIKDKSKFEKAIKKWYKRY